MVKPVNSREFKNFINGRWLPSSSGRTFENHNPANTTMVGDNFPLSEKDDIELAVASARRAFPAWRKLGMVKRAELLWKAARLLED